MKKPEKIPLSFRPRARLLQLLGDQLIGTPRLAVFELVKNAYDADADQVDVTISGIGTADATITVQDDGSGMNLETISDIWLVPAHDHRDTQRREHRRTAKNRLPLGEKGVGRFAVHKLGDAIDLVTRAAGELECHVHIDWDQLIEKKFLSETEVEIETRVPEVFTGESTGTRVVVSRLRERNWSRGEIRRLLRQVTSISSPFVTRSDRFSVELHVPQHEDWVKGVPDVDSLLGRAPWHFAFDFKDGKFSWTYSFRGVPGLKLATRTKADADAKLLIAPDRDIDEFGAEQGVKTGKPRRAVAAPDIAIGVGPLHGEFYVFDRDPEVLALLGDSSLVESFLDENGGVRVYRDGIRVYNYGEPGDDWLGLDLRRVNLPTRNISRNIVVGAIDLVLEDSQGLTEKTNREGFVENDAYRHLRQIVLGALANLEVERKIDKDHIRSITGKGRDREDQKIVKPLERLREAARKHKLSEELDPLINKAERDYEEMRATMLRAGMSGMGLAIVFHEIEQGVRILSDAIESGVAGETVQLQARELVRVLDGFTELLRKGDRQEHGLRQLIRRARDINRVRFRSHQVRLTCPTLDDEQGPDTTSIFAFGLALGALNNLLDNAFYWLQVRWPEDQRDGKEAAIYIRLDPDFAEGPAIIVADNGPGFQDDPERLTRPFFSRRPDGMGVGLYYANMVMELNGGRLVFPDADEADVPAEFDGAVIALVFARGPKP